MATLAYPDASLPSRTRPPHTSTKAIGARADNRSKLRLAIAGCLLLAGWGHTFLEMWLRWFPAWTQTNLPAIDRLTQGDSYYTHGPLVPLTCVLLAWQIRKRSYTPVEVSRKVQVVSGIFLALFLLTHLASVYARVMFVSAFAFVGVLASLLLLSGGTSGLRRYWIPVITLVFMVPLPMAWIAELNFALKMLATNTAVWIVGTVWHVPAVVGGSYVLLPPSSDGATQALLVENVCGGLRSLIALVWFAWMFAALSKATTTRRALVFAMGLPVAMGCNIIRIAVLTTAAHRWGVQAIHETSWLHRATGLLAFALALVAMFLIERALLPRTRSRKLCGASGLHKQRPNRDDASQSQLPVHAAYTHIGPWSLCALTITAALSLNWSRPVVAVETGTNARRALPIALAIEGIEYVGKDRNLDSTTLAILETSDYALRTFSAGDDHPSIDVLLVFSADNRKAVHPPEVCLEGSGQNIVLRSDVTIDDMSAGLTKVAARELVSQRGTQRTYHLYTYRAGDRYTPNFARHQATVFWNGLRLRNASAALLHISTPTAGATTDDARSRCLAAARLLLPQVQERLP